MALTYVLYAIVTVTITFVCFVDCLCTILSLAHFLTFRLHEFTCVYELSHHLRNAFRNWYLNVRRCAVHKTQLTVNWFLSVQTEI